MSGIVTKPNSYTYLVVHDIELGQGSGDIPVYVIKTWYKEKTKPNNASPHIKIKSIFFLNKRLIIDIKATG